MPLRVPLQGPLRGAEQSETRGVHHYLTSLHLFPRHCALMPDRSIHHPHQSQTIDTRTELLGEHQM